MRRANDEIKKNVAMNENDSQTTLFVPLPVVQFVDRALEAERKWAQAEFCRRDAELQAHAQMDILRHETGDARIQKADEVLDHRLEEMNNFRAQINQERVDYLRRDMYEREHDSLSERVKNTGNCARRASGKDGGLRVDGWICGCCGANRAALLEMREARRGAGGREEMP